MYVMFLDDTGRDNDLVNGVGGFIIEGQLLGQLGSRFTARKQAVGIPEGTEVKWSPPHDSWIRQNLIGAAKSKICAELVSLVSELHGSILVALLGTKELGEKAAQAKLQCIEFLVERYQYYLQSQSSTGILILDEASSHKENRLLLETCQGFLSRGTRYVQPNRITMNPVTTHSELSPGIQLADLIVGASCCMCGTNDLPARPVWPQVAACLYRNQHGRASGCGLKAYPCSLASQVYAKLLGDEVSMATQSIPSSQDLSSEELRYLYSQVLSDDLLNAYFGF